MIKLFFPRELSCLMKFWGKLAGMSARERGKAGEKRGDEILQRHGGKNENKLRDEREDKDGHWSKK